MKAHQYDEIIAARVESLVKFGIPKHDIAAHVGLSSKTLYKYYGEIMEYTTECRHLAVKAALFYQATVMNVPSSTIFYLKTQCSDEYGDTTKKEEIKEDLFDALLPRLPD